MLQGPAAVNKRLSNRGVLAGMSAFVNEEVVSNYVGQLGGGGGYKMGKC